MRWDDALVGMDYSSSSSMCNVCRIGGEVMKLSVIAICLILSSCQIPKITYIGTVASIQTCAGHRYGINCSVTLDNGQSIVTREMVALGSRICSNGLICRGGR